jgi:chromosome segregation ATPase
MAKNTGILPGLAAFLAGVAAGALSSKNRWRSAGTESQDLKSAVAQLETRIAAQENANAARFDGIEAKLEDHAARLADAPSTTQIVAAMEQILARTMSSLDDRLNTQARSIETLKATVAQTDALLERVLESLDSLQSFSDSADFAEDTLARQRPA